MSNSPKDDVVVLEGREFKRAKNGLDEAQVESFIDELVRERDKLAQAQDHIASLNRLAERAIVEADKLAAQIKTEATEQAKAESAAILDKAREQARQTAEKKIAEAVELANEKASAIRAKAEEEAAILLENEKNRIRNELRNLVNEQFGYMLDELDRLKQQATAVQADFGTKLAEAGEEDSAVTVKVEIEKAAPAEETVQESNTMVTPESDEPVGERPEPDEPADQAMERATDQAEEAAGLSELLHAVEQPDLGKAQWEVEILPPFEIAKIMEVVSFLDQLPEVASTEMIVPQIDVPLILVFLRKPMNVIDVLQKIPAVASVEEITADKAATNGRPKKVRISLSADKKS